MIWPRNIVAHALRGVRSNKYRSGMTYPDKIICLVDSQMFRRQSICHSFSFICCLCQEDVSRSERSPGWQSCLKKPGSLLLSRFRAPVSGLLVTRTASASGSCSAWATKSAAIHCGFPFSLATTISVGPASMSMPHSNATNFFAVVT